jgi:hypothetical protein
MHGHRRTSWENFKLVQESFLLHWATFSELALGGSSTTPKLPFAPCEKVISVLSKFALTFLFSTYFLDNSHVKIVFLKS